MKNSNATVSLRRKKKKNRKNREGAEGVFFPVIMESADAAEFQRGINLYVAPCWLKACLAPDTSYVSVQRMAFSLNRRGAQGGGLPSPTQLSWGGVSSVAEGHTDRQRLATGGGVAGCASRVCVWTVGRSW